MSINIQQILQELKIKDLNLGASTGGEYFGEKTKTIESYSPVDGKLIAKVYEATTEDLKTCITKAKAAQLNWQKVTAPKRGDFVRQLGDALREKKDSLGALVSYEMGKSLQEGLGEVQEMIDICEFAVGLSRQLYGFTMHSERPEHRMYEQYHPLGVVGIISAFNFPVAVWAWNTALAWVCGNTCVWKPSEKTPLTAIACQNITIEVLRRNNLPEGISCLVNGGAEIGAEMTADKRIALVSATGSTRMGKAVAAAVSARLGKSLLELGGNNALIITPNADLKLAILAAAFGALGTSGQRCTSTRRLIVHTSLIDKVIEQLKGAYQQIKIGSPLDASKHMGPLIDKGAVKMYLDAIAKAKAEGAEVVLEGAALTGAEYESDCYVSPSIFKATNNLKIVQTETFAPILYVIPYDTLDEAIAIQNGVPQGLSSAIFSNNMKETEYFLSHGGSDCGIANVNIGTSGAEIGGAFGGEKETGGGRESGSDAWKAYMRRQTNTINYSDDLPLAQGIEFSI